MMSCVVFCAQRRSLHSRLPPVPQFSVRSSAICGRVQTAMPYPSSSHIMILVLCAAKCAICNEKAAQAACLGCKGSSVVKLHRGPTLRCTFIRNRGHSVSRRRCVVGGAELPHLAYPDCTSSLQAAHRMDQIFDLISKRIPAVHMLQSQLLHVVQRAPQRQLGMCSSYAHRLLKLANVTGRPEVNINLIVWSQASSCSVVLCIACIKHGSHVGIPVQHSLNASPRTR
jgi:hypothetical protein